MKHTRYAIRFTKSIWGERVPYYHCVGSPKDPDNFANARLMDEKALKAAIKDNCRKYIFGKGVEPVPFEIIEVSVEINGVISSEDFLKNKS